MFENSNSNKNHSQKDDFQDAAQIVEIFKIFWRWKYSIFIGTAIICIITLIISFSAEKIYRVGMVLTPGVIGVDDIGRVNYIDKPGNIRSLISSGILIANILSVAFSAITGEK